MRLSHLIPSILMVPSAVAVDPPRLSDTKIKQFCMAGWPLHKVLCTSSNRYVNCSGGREVEIDVPPTMACAQLNRGAVDAIWPRPSGFVDSPYVLYTSDGSKLPSDPDPNASFLAAAAAAGYVSGIAAALAQTLSAVKATATPTPAP